MIIPLSLLCSKYYLWKKPAKENKKLTSQSPTFFLSSPLQIFLSRFKFFYVLQAFHHNGTGWPGDEHWDRQQPHGRGGQQAKGNFSLAACPPPLSRPEHRQLCLVPVSQWLSSGSKLETVLPNNLCHRFNKKLWHLWIYIKKKSGRPQLSPERGGIPVLITSECNKWSRHNLKKIT